MKFSFVRDINSISDIVNNPSNNADNTKPQEMAVKKKAQNDGYVEVDAKDLPKDKEEMWMLLGCKYKDGIQLRNKLLEKNISIEYLLINNTNDIALELGVDVNLVNKFLPKITSEIQNNPHYELTINDIKDKTKTSTLKHSSGKKWFVYQPLGSHNSPDFLFVDNNTILNLECKSGKNGSILWNGGLPQKDTVYVFTSPKLNGNKTTLFMGKDIISDEIYREFENYHGAEKEKSEKFNIDMSKYNNPFGWSHYPRAMYNMDNFALLASDVINKLNESALSYINSL